MNFILSLFFSGLIFAKAPDVSKFDGITAAPLEKSSPTSMKDFKGKIVLMDFWASWCGPCKDALPVYNELYQKYKDRGLILVGINEDDDVKERDLFLKKFSPAFPLYQDKDQEMVTKYQIQALPTLIVFDREQKPYAVHRGFGKGNRPALEKEIETLLAEKK